MVPILTWGLSRLKVEKWRRMDALRFLVLFCFVCWRAALTMKAAEVIILGLDCHFTILFAMAREKKGKFISGSNMMN
jgi:hypothetical protein